jgi:hypothetical protein
MEGRKDMLRTLVAAIVALHGLIHLIGFVVPWRIATVEGFAYRTTVLDGAVSLGDAGVHVLGVIWLAAAAAFVIAGIGIWRRAAWAAPLAAITALASLGLCILGLPETIAGIAVNVAILAAAWWVTAIRRRPEMVGR